MCLDKFKTKAGADSRYVWKNLLFVGTPTNNPISIPSPTIQSFGNFDNILKNFGAPPVGETHRFCTYGVKVKLLMTISTCLPLTGLRPWKSHKLM